MMPNWLYRIVRELVPPLRDQERRMARTALTVAESATVRHQSERVRRLLHSYTRANRRLSDMRR